MALLPFTRPSIDEQTIAGVADVLRSGWITSGPQVQAFEAALAPTADAHFDRVPAATRKSLA